MNGLDFLNLVIGLIFIYLIYSIAASTIWELFVNLTQLRGKMLKDWLLSNFGDLKVNGKNILDHPLIKGLSKDGKDVPSYISAEVFSDALFDILLFPNKNIVNARGKINKDKFLENLKALNLTGGLEHLLSTYLNEPSTTLSKLKEKVGNWYDEAQEQLIGSFKRKFQVWILIISTLLVVSTNADTVKFATYLYNNPDARNSIAQDVNAILEDSTFFENRIYKMDSTKVDSLTQIDQEKLKANIEKKLTELEQLNTTLSNTKLPFGWGDEQIERPIVLYILKKIGGLLLTIFAVSLGSPFWFDVLNKLSNLRSSGNKPKTMQ